MDPDHHRRAALVVLDEVELPPRPARIERSRREPSDETFQRVRAAATGQPDPPQLPGEIEARRIFPPGPGDILARAHAEALVAEPARLEHAFQTLVLERRVEHEHPDDRHAV